PLAGGPDVSEAHGAAIQSAGICQSSTAMTSMHSGQPRRIAGRPGRSTKSGPSWSRSHAERSQEMRARMREAAQAWAAPRISALTAGGITLDGVTGSARRVDGVGGHLEQERAAAVELDPEQVEDRSGSRVGEGERTGAEVAGVDA